MYLFFVLLSDYCNRQILSFVSSKQIITISSGPLLNLQYAGKHPEIHCSKHRGSPALTTEGKAFVIFSLFLFLSLLLSLCLLFSFSDLV